MLEQAEQLGITVAGLRLICHLAEHMGIEDFQGFTFERLQRILASYVRGQTPSVPAFEAPVNAVREPSGVQETTVGEAIGASNQAAVASSSLTASVPSASQNMAGASRADVDASATAGANDPTAGHVQGAATAELELGDPNAEPVMSEPTAEAVMSEPTAGSALGESSAGLSTPDSSTNAASVEVDVAMAVIVDESNHRISDEPTAGSALGESTAGLSMPDSSTNTASVEVEVKMAVVDESNHRRSDADDNRINDRGDGSNEDNGRSRSGTPIHPQDLIIYNAPESANRGAFGGENELPEVIDELPAPDAPSTQAAATTGGQFDGHQIAAGSAQPSLPRLSGPEMTEASNAGPSTGAEDRSKDMEIDVAPLEAMQEFPAPGMGEVSKTGSLHVPDQQANEGGPSGNGAEGIEAARHFRRFGQVRHSRSRTASPLTELEDEDDEDDPVWKEEDGDFEDPVDRPVRRRRAVGSVRRQKKPKKTMIVDDHIDEETAAKAKEGEWYEVDPPCDKCHRSGLDCYKFFRIGQFMRRRSCANCYEKKTSCSIIQRNKDGAKTKPKPKNDKGKGRAKADGDEDDPKKDKGKRKAKVNDGDDGTHGGDGDTGNTADRKGKRKAEEDGALDEESIPPAVKKRKVKIEQRE